jgi:hypothetical protein
MNKLLVSFNNLLAANQQLSLQIQASDIKGWVCGDQKNISDALITAYSDYWYYQDSDGRKTKNYHGLFLANTAIIKTAEEVNIAKTIFRQAAQELQKQDRQLWLSSYGNLNDQRRRVLKSANIARLNLKQAYRLIPIIDATPEKIGFSWYTQGKSITRISKQKAYERLCKYGDNSHIEIQKKKLASLNDYEELAIVQKQAPLVRANIVSRQQGKVSRRAMNSSLPFMLASIDNNILPEFNKINTDPPLTNTRLRRSDNKISDEVFLPSIRAYRYI